MTFLKNILRINAVSSGATALLLIAFSDFIADLFGTSQTGPFIGVGILLLLFALYVFIQSRKIPLSPKEIQLIIALDISWVVGSAGIIVPRLFDLSQAGYLLIGGVALWVAAMAVLQFLGFKKQFSS